MMPLANALISNPSEIRTEEKFPLKLSYCSVCALTQITETVPPEKMFKEYSYFSSFSATMLDHARSMVDWLIQTRGLTPASLVIELASNDGYLLQYFLERGVPVLGIEPAANVARVATEKRGIPTICEFFGPAVAERLRRENKLADVVIANNVLAHVPDLHGFLSGLRSILQPTGVAVIEVPYLMDLIDRCEFDTIYHEHLCYFALTPLIRLFQKNGLVITDAEKVAIHGGSLRISAGVEGSGAMISSRVGRLLDEESNQFSGGARSKSFVQFADRVKALRENLVSFLRREVASGKRVAAYGAAAKGCVLMNYCRIGPDLVEFVVDRNPVKQGRFMPGTHQPVYAPTRLSERPPDYLMILPWNLTDEIVKQESEYRSRGGRFLVAVPDLRVIE